MKTFILSLGSLLLLSACAKPLATGPEALKSLLTVQCDSCHVQLITQQQTQTTEVSATNIVIMPYHTGQVITRVFNGSNIQTLIKSVADTANQPITLTYIPQK